jgi:hypothetical protein
MTDVTVFGDLTSGSHTARFSAIAPTSWQTGTDPVGEPLLVTGGRVLFDATSDVWASGSITVIAPWPGPTNELITVFGGEIFLARGVETGAGGTMWSPMGYFRVTTDTQDDAAKGPITITLDDRMATLIESELITPRVFEPGTTVQAMVENLVLDVYPLAVIEYDSNTDAVVLGRQITVAENRYEGLSDLADSLGQYVHFDERGVLRFADIPTTTEPVWTIRAGRRGSMVRPRRSLTRVGVYNAVAVFGEGMDDTPPVHAVAYDGGPTSPTRWGGPFGMIPRRYASPFITTWSGARSAASAMLRRSLGAPYSVSVSIVPNPALRPYMPIRLIYDDGTREMHVIDKFELPFDTDTDAGIDTRDQSVTYVRVE